MHDFVILFHALPTGSNPTEANRDDHWDLMLEHEGELLSWALNCNPLESNGAIGIRLPNHRLDYLNLEGEISNNRGHITRIARGRFRWERPLDEMEWSAVLTIDNGDKFRCLCSVSDASELHFDFERCDER